MATRFHQHHHKSIAGTNVGSTQVSVCTQQRKCRECCKLLKGVKEQTRHRCCYIDCPSCHEYMEAAIHKCYIQIAKSPEQEKAECKKKSRKKQKQGAAAGLATLEANGEGMDLDEDDEKLPLHVFFDIEAMQDTGRHVANLVVAETEDNNRPNISKVLTVSKSSWNGLTP